MYPGWVWSSEIGRSTDRPWLVYRNLTLLKSASMPIDAISFPAERHAKEPRWPGESIPSLARNRTSTLNEPSVVPRVVKLGTYRAFPFKNR